MKVLKTKDGNDEWKAEIECHECHAQLEITKDDLYAVNTAMAYAGETWEPEVCVDCGNCESQITVTDKIQSGIRDRLYDEFRSKKEE